MTTQETYNGYTNYETFLVSINTDGIELEMVFGEEENVENTYDNAEIFKAFVEEHVFENSEDMNPLALDLLNAAFSKVNWKELLEELIEQ